MKLKGDQGTSRQINRRLILNLLRANGPMSRAQISSRSGLSPAAVTFVVSDLIEEDILLEGQASKGATGRRPIPIEINYAGNFTIGIKLMVDTIECALTDLSTNVLTSLIAPLPDQSPKTVVRVSVSAIDHLLTDAKIKQSQLIGIGIAMPGIVDTRSGIVKKSHRFGWLDVPLAALLAEQVKVHVWIDDDTNAFALAQTLFGLGRQCQTAGALAIGAGISCAVVVNGSIHHGAHGAAGKLGHVIVDPDGQLCECGKKGCLQTLYSETSLVRRWISASGSSAQSTRFDMLAAAKRGERLAIDMLEEAGARIGACLATFCNIVDPELIFVGGEAVTFGDFLFDPMREALSQHCLWDAPEVSPDWADNAWARGAAALATQQLFDFEAGSGTKAEPRSS